MPVELALLIAAEIAAGGPMRFDRFMELALYHPAHGFYGAGRVRIGHGGDFTTSAHISGLYAGCVANLVVRADEALGHPRDFFFVEGGPGEGELAAGVLTLLEREHPELYSRLRYLGDEVSGALAERQAAALTSHTAKVTTALPDGFEGLYFSNELPDAMPVRIFQHGGGTTDELTVDADLDGDGNLRGFKWRRVRAAEDGALELARRVARNVPVAKEDEGAHYRVEVCEHLGDWLGRVSDPMGRGFIVTVDYGDLEGKLYGPHRAFGTLRGFRDYGLIDDVITDIGPEGVGVTDITASVNFSHLIREAEALGLACGEVINQREFLFSLGVVDRLEQMSESAATEAERLSLRQELWPLVFSGAGMGESFKALALGVGIQPGELRLDPEGAPATLGALQTTGTVLF